MYAKRCFRTLDRPLEFFGLEVEDWGLLIIGSGAVIFVLGAIPAAVLALGGWFALRKIKSGKPAGYLFSLLYQSGFILVLPSLFRPRGLLRPSFPFTKNRRVQLSAFHYDRDHETAHARFYYDL